MTSLIARASGARYRVLDARLHHRRAHSALVLARRVNNLHWCAMTATNPFAAVSSIFDAEPATLVNGAHVVVDARGRTLSVLTKTGCTCTVSRVDSDSAATPQSSDTAANTDVGPNALLTFSDWPFYRLAAAGGDCRYYVA